MPDNTILRLAAIGIPPYSARGLRQSLEPIQAASAMRRTEDGTLVDISAPELRKYRSTITGDDQDPPAFEAFWPGMQLSVDCIVELAYATHTAAPDRDIVTDSERSADGFTFYRPQLTMMAVSWNVERDEWGAAVRWSLELEEV